MSLIRGAKGRTWNDAISDACDAYAAGDDSKLALALRLVEAAGSQAAEIAPDPIMVEVFQYRDGMRIGYVPPSRRGERTAVGQC